MKLSHLFLALSLPALAGCDGKEPYMCNRPTEEFVEANRIKRVQTGTRTELDASYIAIFGFPLPVQRPVYGRVERSVPEMNALLEQRRAACAAPSR